MTHNNRCWDSIAAQIEYLLTSAFYTLRGSALKFGGQISTAKLTLAYVGNCNAASRYGRHRAVCSKTLALRQKVRWLIGSECAVGI